MSEVAEVIGAIASLAWPVFIIVVVILNQNKFKKFIELLLFRFEGGAEIVIGSFTIGKSVGKLKEPEGNALVTDDHIALIHRSWRVPNRDKEFPGSKMYQIHVIVFGTDAALKKIEKVVYHLDQSYSERLQTGGTIQTQFELKELANGHSLLRAEVFIKGQKEVIHLSRFIDLTETSEPLKGTYQVFGN